jgi:hypothetical protein
MLNDWVPIEPSDEDCPPPPIFRIDGIIDLIALAFSLWFCITFVANPVDNFVTDWLHGSPGDHPKDQTKLPEDRQAVP